MYKLFLCLRYLRRRIIAYFAMISVALCVAMLLIVTSVMNGFLHKIELAAKGLFGDIIISGNTVDGISLYDEFIAELQAKMPDVRGTPYIQSYGLLRVPRTQYQQPVSIAGIRLPQRAAVTDFSKDMFVQGGSPEPTFDPPIDLLIKKTQQDYDDLKRRLDQERATDAKAPSDKRANTITDLEQAIVFHQMSLDVLKRAQPRQKDMQDLWRQYVKLEHTATSPTTQSADQAGKLAEQMDDIVDRTGFDRPDRRIIVSRGLPGITIRLDDDTVVRNIVPGQTLSLTMLPLGQMIVSSKDMGATGGTFTVVDDVRAGVHSIDTNVVYVPFETLQQLNEMGPRPLADGRILPARCSAIHLKVGDGTLDEKTLGEYRRQIEEAYYGFVTRHPEAARKVTIETWRENQKVLISNISAQRTLVIVMFGVISLVAVVLVFVLFYTIVVQKTKDIGVLKAVGGSSWGVAQIFLAYGAAIGLVGSLVGVIIGVVFVHYINPIHAWVGQTFGLQVFTKEWFLFDSIPNEIETGPAVVIVLSAIAAGLIGSLLPATLAARMQPVEALRYE